MKIKTIFLDLDDVLNRFTMYALEHVGCDVNAYDESSYKPEWGFDIVKAANALSLNRNELSPGAVVACLHPIDIFFSPEIFWSRIGREVWAYTPVSEEDRFLINECRQ